MGLLYAKWSRISWSDRKNWEWNPEPIVFWKTWYKCNNIHPVEAKVIHWVLSKHKDNKYESRTDKDHKSSGQKNNWFPSLVLEISLSISKAKTTFWLMMFKTPLHALRERTTEKKNICFFNKKISCTIFKIILLYIFIQLGIKIHLCWQNNVSAF